MRNDDLSLLRDKLEEIKEMGWIRNQRPGNAGGVGNTLEDLLDVAENNLQLPDFGDWELKSQRANTGSLLTLFHTEPQPRAAKIVPQILLLKYGWPHQEAGTTYPANERSFRQTINATAYSDRGFRVNVDYNCRTVFISFDYSRIDDRHDEWRTDVRNRIGTGDIIPNPFWTFRVIEEKLSTKLNNLMYVRADRKTVDGEEYFKYNQIEAYVDPTLDRFLALIEDGVIYVDFDARTGHNHGTKFRIRPSSKTDLYQKHIIV
ncbi:MAG: MvaI/BcnI family restriction endonuclease [Bacillota bacterium]|nr:MvaI/BcnI family restriction endonuclease [Bacillota bacterium]